jgi:FlaG/FlaF family flagellin (archaellin)
LTQGRTALLLLLAAALSLGVPAGAAWGSLSASPATATLLCDAAYLPARTSWLRRVDIGYDRQHVRSVHIDGVPVYTFSIRGTVILTALDNERIQIDTASMTWTSDFRGLATAQGRCERAP